MEQILLWASKKERKSRPSSTKAFLTCVWHSSFRFMEWLTLLPTSIFSSSSVVFCLRLSGTPWRGSLRYAGPWFSVSTSAPLWEIHTSLHSLHPWLPAPSLGTSPSSPFPLLVVHSQPEVPSSSTPRPIGRCSDPSNSEPPQEALHCLKKHVLCPRSEHGRFGVWWQPASYMCPLMAEGARELCGVPFLRAPTPFMTAPPSRPNHLLTPPHWGSGFDRWILGVHKHSVYSNHLFYERRFMVVTDDFLGK